MTSYTEALRSTLPEWHPDRHEPTFLSDDEGDGGGERDEVFYGQAIGIVGMNHIFDNLSKDVDKKPNYFEPLTEEFTNSAVWLCTAQSRKKVYYDFVSGSSGLEKCLPGLDEL